MCIEHNSRLAVVETQMDSISAVLARIEGKVDKTNDHLITLNGRTGRAEADIKVVQDNVKGNTDQLNNLKTRMIIFAVIVSSGATVGVNKIFSIFGL